jgi:hypothetical protein
VNGVRPAVLAVLAGILCAPAAGAWMPDTSRIANAVAQTNRESGRVRTLRMEVELRFEGDPEIAATGVLWSDPEGSARLELVSPRGFVERHLVRGRLSESSRDGVRQEAGRTFLPPYFLLQATSAGTLTNWLIELGARVGESALGYEGDHDCYVLGGRALGSPAGQAIGESRAAPRAALWVDSDAFGVVRFDSADGARFRFGPGARFGPVTVPGWIDIHTPDEPAARLAVLSAEATTMPPGGFAPAWLVQAVRGAPGRSSAAGSGEMP